MQSGGLLAGSFLLRCVLGALLFAAAGGSLAAQEKAVPDSAGTAAEAKKPRVAEQIKVAPAVSDEAINQRLTSILQASGWFTDVSVRVEEGLVFLDGRTSSPEHRDWAGELARKILDVVAVVNRIEVAGQSLWDVEPAISELEFIWQGTLARVPRLVVSLFVLGLVWLLVRMVAGSIRKVLARRLKPLLTEVATRVISILLFLIGIYLALQVAGLSGLAATVLGGTGIVGLVAGIAFRDILENYLASILISIRNPFKIGDLVEINEHTGIIERVTTRGTVLMNLDGNHVQIPNAIIYKSIIRNYTANPNRRDMFEVGIGFDNEAAHAQDVALAVVAEHPAVLDEPEPLVLVDRLGSATVGLKIYFWYDGLTYNGLKVKSSLIRLVKRTFENEGISMPDEAREILFPQGVPVQMLQPPEHQTGASRPRQASAGGTEPDVLSTEAEGDLTSEGGQLRTQARTSRIPEEGASLIEEEHG